MKSLIALMLMFMASTVFAGNPHINNCTVHYPAKTYVAPVYHTPAPVYHAPTYYAPPQPIFISVPVAYEKPLAVQGLTTYSYTKASDLIGPLDYALYADQAGRYSALALQLAEKGNTGMNDIAKLHLQATKELANTALIGQVSREIIRSVSDAQLRQAQISAAQGNNQAGTLQLREATTADEVMQLRCASCHEKYSQWTKLSFDTQELCLEHIESREKNKQMPRASDKASPGEPLPIRERMLLYKELKDQ